MRRLRNIVFCSVTPLCGMIAVDAINENKYTTKLKRNIRTLYTTFDILNNYYWKSNEQDQNILHELHEYAADRMLRLFQKNGGVYIKIGQHLASLDHLIPPEFCSKMKVLFQSAPISSQQDVDSVILDELGRTRQEIFSYFDPIPLGAASLAQVHQATIRESGKKVAVKIQHKRLKNSARNDISISSFLFGKIRILFPGFEFGWLAEEMRLSLPLEMDFLNEANNAELMRAHMAGLDEIVFIPKVHFKYTSKRILTMELVEGIGVTDLSTLKRYGISGKEICERISDVVCKMIFKYKLLHCDPHPGNLLIFVDKKSKQKRNWKLVLLDHGQYRRLTDKVVFEYAELWRNLVFFNEDGLKEICQQLGMEATNYKTLSAILSQSTWKFLSKRNSMLNGGEFDITEFQRKSVENFPAIIRILSSLPRELLLVFKTNDIVRSLERKLTGSYTQRIYLRSTLKYSFNCIFTHLDKFSLWGKFKFIFQFALFKISSLIL